MRDRSNAPERQRRRRAGGPMAAVVGVALLLMIPALINGFPFITSDTVTYLGSGIMHWVPQDRPIFYGLFAAAFFSQASPWGPVVAQGLSAGFLVCATARHIFEVRDGRWQVAIGAGLALGSSLPWCAGELSPDVFAGLLILAALLIFLRWERLALWERTLLLFGLALSVSTHQSHVLLAAGAPMVFAVLWALRMRPSGALAPRLAAFAAASLAGAAAIVLSNGLAHHRPSLAPSGPTFLLGRLLEDGSALSLLEARCPTAPWRICAELADLKAHAARQSADGQPLSDYFLWGGPVIRLGGPMAYAPEAMEIAREAIGRAPVRQTAAFARNSLDQWLRFQVVLRPAATDDGHAFYGELYGDAGRARLEEARQNRGGFPSRAMNGRLSGLVALSALAMAAAGFAWRNGAAPIRPFLLGATLFVLGNGAIMGGLSGVFDRYQARVIWLIPMSALMLAASLATHRREALIALFRRLTAPFRAAAGG